jgi:hypothetical protein
MQDRSENPVAESGGPADDIEGGTLTHDDELVRLIDARLDEKLAVRDVGGAPSHGPQSHSEFHTPL